MIVRREKKTEEKRLDKKYAELEDCKGSNWSHKNNTILYTING